MKTKGSIAQLIKNERRGYILGHDGCRVAFDKSSFLEPDPGQLTIGDWVEYEELDLVEGRRAFRIEPLIQRGEE